MHHSLWLRALSRALFVRRSSSSQKHRSPTRRVRLGLERLEDRLTPSANTTTALTSLVPNPVIYNSAGENVSVTATVTNNANGNGVSEGQVQFGIDNNNLGSPVTLPSVPPSPAGTFTLSTTVPDTYNVGTHTLDALFSDPGSRYNSSSGYGSLTIAQANSSMTVSETNSPIYNSGSETIDLKANITSTNGGTVNQGSVVFTVNGVSSAAEPVVNGVATDALVLPTASVLNAGNYPGEITANYTDTTADYASANASSDVIVGAAATTTTITSPAVSSTYNSGANQGVTLTASVVNTNGGGAVNEGDVLFTIINPHGSNLTVTSGTVTNGTATATLLVPAGFATGNYSISATYADPNNIKGIPNYDSSTAATNGVLTVNSAATQTTITPTLVTSPYSTSAQSVTLTADVTSSSGGTVNEGAVTFTVDNPNGTFLTATAKVIGGVASTSLTVPANFAAGSYVFSASYADIGNVNGNVNYSASTAATSGTLAVATETTTTLNGANVSSTFNSTTPQTVTLSASVTSPGGTVSEGNVTFTVTNPNGANLTVTRAVVNGTATATLSIPADFAAGSYTYNASYADIINANNTVNFASSTAATPGHLTVNAAATQTTITPALVTSPSFSTTPQTVTLTADVTSTSGGTVNEGTVIFVVNGLTTTANVIAGTATASLIVPANYAAGSYSISASYADPNNVNGTPNYDASTAATSGTLVIASATTTTLNGANVSSTFNSLTPQTVTLSASVTSPGGTVNEGNVTFTVTNPNGANLTVTRAVVNGTATATLSIPADFAAGKYSFNASYADIINANNTVNFASSTAATPGKLTVNAATTQTTITSTLVNTTFNSTTPQTVTLTASVTSADGNTVYEGVVTFTVNGLTTTAKVIAGTATATLTVPADFAAGSYSVGASYTDITNANGNVNYDTSTAATPGTLVVASATTTTTITTPTVSSTFNSGTNQEVTLSANVASGTGGTVNEGNVTFTVTNPNGANLTVMGAVVNGTATATLLIPADFAAGGYSFNASYADTLNANNTDNFASSTAATPGHLTVNAAATQTTITPALVTSPSFSTTPQTVTLTADVTSTSGGTVNEGTVTFVVNGLTTTANVIAGTATASLIVPANYAAGSYSISASYADPNNVNGTPNYDASTAATSGTLVIASATTTTLNGANVSSTFNSTTPQTVTLSASVTSPGGTVNEGNVTFTVTNPNGANLTVMGAVVNGEATATLSIPADFAAGKYSFNASYADIINANNTVNFASSTAATPGKLTVNAAATETTISPALVISPFSTSAQSVTLTADVTAANGGTVNEGVVTFVVTNPNGPNVTATANVVGGVATASLTVPADFAAGSYSFGASYADITNANGNVNYDASTAATSGTLAIAPATTTTLNGANVSSTFNSLTPQTVTLSASVTSPGGTVNEGNVTFTVTNPNGANLTVTGAVVNGEATATLTIPADFAAGSYTYNASYADIINVNNTVNFASSTATKPGKLTVNPAATETTLITSSLTSTFNSTTPQMETLVATVTSSNGGPINEGVVTFTVINLNGPNLTVSANVSNDAASTTLTLPANFAAGTYKVTASYLDSANANGAVDYSASTASSAGTLTVNAASTQTFLTSTSVSSVFNDSTAQAVNLTASVTSSNGGIVNEGNVIFTLTNPNGASLTATGIVSGGTATATLSVPAGFAVGTYSFSASYADTNNANGVVNYNASSASTIGTLVVKTASTQTTISTTPVSSIYNSDTAQNVALVAFVTSPDGGTVNEGVVTFTVTNPNGPNLTTSANVINGVATASVTVSPGFAAGNYSFGASYVDPTNANGLLNYSASSATTPGTLFVVQATTTTLTAANVSSTFNSTTPQTITLVASVASPNGGTVNEGNVTFTVTNPNGTNLTATGAVSNGSASATLTIPADFAAGSYKFNATYTDTLNVNNTVNYASSTTATPSTLTVNAATTQATITSTPVTSTFNSTTPQSVTLTANVTSATGGTVNEGAVNFAVNGLMTSAKVVNGTATATLSIPAEFAAGSYSINAGYVDSTNANGNLNFVTSVAAPGTLIVAQATTTTTTANVSSTFNSATPQTVTLDATVASPNGGIVNEGNVTFTVTNPNGADLTATGAVNGSGMATATLTIPADFAAGSYKLNASYSDTLNANALTNFASSTTATPSTLTVSAASTQTTITSTAVSSTFNSTTPQSVTLTADVTSASGGTVNEGAVTFTLVNPNGASLTSTANVINGTVTTTLAIPPEFAAGSYVINASYTDSNNVNGSPNYSGSTAATSGALTVNAAPTTTSITSSAVSSIFNSGTAQTVNLSATVASTTGGTVNEGVVTFTVTNPNGANLTVAGNVGSNGAVTATLTIPAGFAAGSYTFNASYVDAANANGKVNFDSSMATTPGTLTVQAAISQTSVVVSPNSITFSPNGQTVTATAQVVSKDGGTVNQGNVTFSLNGVTPVTVAVNGNGQATVTLQVPPGFAPGAYALTASYADSANANGKTSFAASSGAATLNVAPAPSSVAITQVFEVAGNGLVAELVTAQVTDAFGPVNGGVVQFNIDGHIVDSSVHSGQATGFVILPQAVVAVPEAFSASYTPPTSQFIASNDSVVALWTILNFVEPGGYVRFGPDGSQVVVVVFSDGVQFGLTYDSTGQHTGFEIGVQPGLLSV